MSTLHDSTRSPAAIIRPAVLADVSAIASLTNHYVLNTASSYQIRPDTPQQMEKWFASHGEKHPLLVAQLAQSPSDAQSLSPPMIDRIVAWGGLTPFRSREAYALTVENSLYVHPQFHRRGIGRAMLAELIAQAQALGHHSIVAVIDSEQAASIALHARLGFAEVGRLAEVGWKFDRWCSTVYMQKLLK